MIGENEMRKIQTFEISEEQYRGCAIEIREKAKLSFNHPKAPFRMTVFDSHFEAVRDLELYEIEALRDWCNDALGHQEWLPIEDAPCDGTRLLLLVPPYGPSTGHYDNGWHAASVLNNDAQPTHYQPLTWECKPRSDTLEEGGGVTASPNE